MRFLVRLYLKSRSIAMIKDLLSRAKESIQSADAILITAGAGMGVDSGLPDFRGNEGFWKAYPPLRKIQLSFSEMASPQWFDTKAEFAWAFYGHRLNLYRKTIPHDGFDLLLDLVERKNSNYFIYTSNVDGQFQKAGFDAMKIVEVHGSIHHLQCCENCSDLIYPADDIQIKVDIDKFKAQILRCPICKGVARPNILMFGDWHYNSKRTDNQEELFDKWLKNIQKNSEKLTIIEIGAGEAVPTIRNFGNFISSRYKDAKLIRINPVDSQVQNLDDISICLGGLKGIKSLCSTT